MSHHFSHRLTELLTGRTYFPGIVFLHRRRYVYEGDESGGSNTYDMRVHAPMGSPWAVHNVTGEAHPWSGRWWRLSPHMTDGEIVQTAFKALMTALEHEVREQFKYDGVTVFDPHYDIDALVTLRREGLDGGLKERD